MIPTTVPPLVSILINNYNYGRFLEAAIASALNQTYAHIEVIVVDDGSTDHSPELIAGYGDRIIPILKTNGGQSSAMNAGLAASQGDIICFLDADDLFLPEKVAEIVEIFQTSSSVGWVFHESDPRQSEDIDHSPLSDLCLQAIHHNAAHPFQSIDFRIPLRNAQLPTFTPSTSNLCLSRTLAAQIFPIPEERGRSGMAITDFYVKYLAVGLNTGYASKRNLGIFRLHSQNTCSAASGDRQRMVYTEIYLVTAYWMRVNFPEFSRLSQKLFSRGLALGLKSNSYYPDNRRVIQAYWSASSYLEKLQISGKAFYYFLKLGFVGLI
jgi:glycosyltransferase involved in cell wall biosynthesis